MKISAHISINHGESYDHPYQEAIQSLLWCDEVIVGYDPRFNDRTVIKQYPNVRPFIHEFDWDHPNPHGMMKQLLRQQCTGDWILEIEPDEYFPQEGIQKVQDTLSSTPKLVNLMSVESRYIFNGYWVHRAMPKYRPCLSRNIPEVRHSIDKPNYYGRWGSAYITSMGISYPPQQYLPITLWNFEWYSLPRRWMQKQYYHYIEGQMKNIYSGLDSYHQNLDGEEVIFWDVPQKFPLSDYIPAIRVEMFPRLMSHDGLPYNKLKRFYGKLPSALIPWASHQEIVKMRRWLLWLSRGMLW